MVYIVKYSSAEKSAEKFVAVAIVSETLYSVHIGGEDNGRQKNFAW